jgi:hypothetical protein
MIHEYVYIKWILDLLVATSQPALPEAASASQSQVRSRPEDRTVASPLRQHSSRQPATVEDSLACTEPPRKEDQQAAARKITEPRQSASRYEESFARLRTNGPSKGFSSLPLRKEVHHRSY